MSTALGFRFRETMAGTYTPAGGGAPRRFSFSVDVVSSNLWSTLRTGRARMSGHVEADGLAVHAELEGFITMRPLVARFVRYEFGFTGDDGTAYSFAGQKDILHLHPMRTWTTLPGVLRDARGTEVGRALTRFDFAGLGPFLASFRLRRGSAHGDG